VLRAFLAQAVLPEAARVSTPFQALFICCVALLLAEGLFLSPFPLSASSLTAAGGDEERRSTGAKLVEPKFWMQAKLDHHIL